MSFVTEHHRIYPTVDPKVHFEGKTYEDKVVLVTGASRGIGRDTARYYALAGASLALVARSHDTLEEAKADILKEVPGVKVLIFAADVKDHEQSQRIVEETVKYFGRLDILVANAGTLTPMTDPLGDKDPFGWWRSFEVNIRGVFNFIRPAIAHLKQANGYIVAVTSGASLLKFPGGSDYSVSKLALNRLIELIPIEYPEVKSYAVHPGVIDTETCRTSGLAIEMPDTTELPAATLLYLTSGKVDYLTGRYLSANWDLGELERDWKDKVVEQDGLVLDLRIPK